MEILELNDRLLLWIGVILYSLAFAYSVLAILNKKESHSKVLYILLTIGFAAQSVGLYIRGINDQSFPLHNAFEILQVIIWSAVMMEFFIRPAFRIRLLGVFTAGLGSILGTISLMIAGLDSAITPPAETVNPWIGFHAALAVFSYGVFALLSATAVMYLLQHTALRKKQTGGLFMKLPSIRQLDEINKRLLLVGVSILTVAVGIGFINWLSMPGDVGTGKLIAAVLVWLGYLGAYQLRSSKKLIASQFAWACVLLFIFALLSLWPLNTTLTVKKPDPSSTEQLHS